jgi:nucleoside-diphosphate-sugar epimerase
MRVLIIGGTKYFGKIIARRLLERGDHVTLFTRGNTRPEFWDQVEAVLGDRKEYAAFEREMAGRTIDAVIDQQAYTREDQESAVRAFHGRVGRYLLTSTISVYYDGYIDFHRHCPIREDDLPLDQIGWDYPEGHDRYAVGKRHCEKVLLDHAAFPSTAIRVPPVLGPEDWTLRFWNLLQRVLDGGEIPLPDGGLNIFRNIYSEDMAQAFIDVMDEPRTIGRTYNVAQWEIMTQRLFVEQIAAAAGRAVPLVPVPRAVLDAAGCRLMFGRPELCVEDLTRAEQDFALRTTPVAEWVQTTVDWYLANRPEKDSAAYDRRPVEIQLARLYRDRAAALEAEACELVEPQRHRDTEKN